MIHAGDPKSVTTLAPGGEKITRRTAREGVKINSQTSGAQTARLPGKRGGENIRYLSWVDGWLYAANRKLIAMQAGVNDRSEKLNYTPDERLAMALDESHRFATDKELDLDEETKLKILIGRF